jgi:transposase
MQPQLALLRLVPQNDWMRLYNFSGRLPMPWKTIALIEQREEFVRLAIAGNETFARLCRSFGISRQTGYKWVHRFDAARSHLALQDRSRRPQKLANSVPVVVKERVVQLRVMYGWGARRITEAIRQEGLNIGHTTTHRILKERRLVPSHHDKGASWIIRVFTMDHPESTIASEVPQAEPVRVFADQLRHGSRRNRTRAMSVIARLKGMPLHVIAESLNISVHTVLRYVNAFREGGVDVLFPKPKSRVNDEPHRSSVFAVLHSPPSAYSINRTTWIMEDLHRVLAKQGHHLSERRIRRIIKAGGFRWRKAKVVLTSTDPEYATKLADVKRVLAELKPDEAFFSIDEYGPFAIKKKPGRRRVGPDEEYIVLQFQKSKGWLILTAALELSRNQVTHFYSRRKNTDEMIKMAELLRSEYRDCCRIYLSWDAASWHISKKLVAHLEECNAVAREGGGWPVVLMAPLPAGAQFLNVIESVFSGMSRAIIHNSDYPSVEAAKSVIDRYFRERNAHFLANPRRAGQKIWSQEPVPSEFNEGQNCKDPRYR